MKQQLKWDYEPEVIKEYLSKFYESPFACVREYVANAIAAHHRAGVKDPVVVEITPKKIVIEDRGTGITKETLENVFRWFGRSENKNLEGVQGRLGLGAKSFMMLTESEGKVIMKTRCRDTDESYSAVLTCTGIEVKDDGGKKDYGTRFEIYPAKPLQPRDMHSFVESTVSHFRYSRIPVVLRACSPEKFEVDLHERILSRAKAEGVNKQGLHAYVTSIEVELGIHHEDIEILGRGECYEAGIFRGYFKNRRIIVIGDVLVEGSYNYYYWREGDEPGTFIRITAEDGRPVEIMGVTIKAPEPMPNREGYRNLETFKNALLLLLKVYEFKESYGRVLGCSADELIRYNDSGLKVLSRAIDKVIKRAAEIEDADFNEALERELPSIFALKNTVSELLHRFVYYGLDSHLSGNKRSKMSLASALRRMKRESKVFYITKRPSAKQDHLLEREGIIALYAPEPSDWSLLEKYGIKMLTEMPAEKTLLKVYTKRDNIDYYHNNRDGYRFMTAEEVFYDWAYHAWDQYPPLVTVALSLGSRRWNMCPPGIIAVGNKTQYKKLKRWLGDFANTPEGWTEWQSPSIKLVTDGNTVWDEPPEDEFNSILLSDIPSEVLPVLSKILGKNCYKLLYDGIAKPPEHTKRFGKEFAEEYIRWFANDQTKEALRILAYSRGFSIAEDVRVFIREFLPVLGKTEKELREEVRPRLTEELKEKALMRLGEVSLGDLLPWRLQKPESQEELDNIIIQGLQLPNPLIEDGVLKDAECAEAAVAFAIRNIKSGYEVRAIAALAYHHEVTGEPDEDIIQELMSLKKGEILREDLHVIAKLAPTTVGPKLLAILI